MGRRPVLKELAAGNTVAAAMAELAMSNLRPKRQRLAEALEEAVAAHQRFLLRSQVELIEVMEKQIEAIDREVEKRMRPFQAALDLIDQIRQVASVLLAEAELELLEVTLATRVGYRADDQSTPA